MGWSGLPLAFAFLPMEVPAPFWFVQFFKVVGFVLHMIPMGIWFAGLPVVILCALWNGKHSRFYARRMSAQLPVMMALGINFAIVPLLFLQTTYYKAFYTATILTAWYWLAVIPILIVGYYSIYIAAYSGERRGRRILFSILASLCLIEIALLITNGLTLMVSSEKWAAMIDQTSHYGAVWGTAHNFSDQTLWLRLAAMFGLGLLTAGVWATFDAHFLKPKNAPENYRQWATTLAVVMAFAGLMIITGLECVTRMENDALHQQKMEIIAEGIDAMSKVEKIKELGFSSLGLAAGYPHFEFYITPLIIFTFVTLLTARFYPGWWGSARVVGFAAALQFFALAGFGVIRQIGQNDGMATFVDVSTLPEKVQWSPLIAFVVCFLLGVGVIVWMVVQCVKCAGSPPTEPQV